jgi:hypothetical protein
MGMPEAQIAFAHRTRPDASYASELAFGHDVWTAKEKAMRNACLLLWALMCFTAVPVHAQQVSRSGNAFLQDCSMVDKPVDDLKSSELLRADVCLAYVVGLLDGISLQISLSRSAGHSELFPFCVSEHVPNGELARILLKYIRANPATADLRTAELFGSAR